MTQALAAKPAQSALFRPALRKRAPVYAEYARDVRDEERMIHWLALVAKEARLAADRKQVHIGAAADVDQSVIARFERGRTWPRELDAILKGYEDDLGLDPLSLWIAAIEARRQSSEDGGELSFEEAADELPDASHGADSQSGR